jgi:hypothetical protein
VRRRRPTSTPLRRRATPDLRWISIGCLPPNTHQHRLIMTDKDQFTQVARQGQEAITTAMRT